MNRHRRLIALACVVLALLAAVSFGWKPATASRAKKKVLILGIDGLDPKILNHFMDLGEMPNFKRLAETGDYKPLQTSMPPQSPVAWSTFITGMDPGGHGIYDFVHRDPLTMMPEMSMSKTEQSDWTLKMGNWVMPLSGGKIVQQRKGEAFWQVLEKHGVPTTIFRIPANFPPVDSPGKSFSGMGTPDIKGTPGTFSFYTDYPPANARDVSGGVVYEVEVVKGVVEANLYGPTNVFRREPRIRRDGQPQRDDDGNILYDIPEMKVPFRVVVDAEQKAAKFEVQNQTFVLLQGEWSDWIPFDFKPVPLMVTVSAACRFYLQEAAPDFKLYVSPLQISVKNPAMPITTPSGWANDLYEDLGYFYTQELPEDTKALSNNILSGTEFHDQAMFVYRENRRIMEHQLDAFKEGLLFFYFSSIDQQSHMIWRYIDKDHPGFDPSQGLSESMLGIYRHLDDSLGYVMERIDGDTTLIVMSDHGFCPYYWGFNLNSWLLEKGYITLPRGAQQRNIKYFTDTRTGRSIWTHGEVKAYALGLNGLYINLKGREANGTVDPSEYDALIDQLEKDLLAIRDPRTGDPVVTYVCKVREAFKGPNTEDGPDILVGFNWGYRSSWESPLGDFPEDLIVANTEAWSGDHCVDYRLVPGVLLTNQRITMDEPALYDLTVAVLDEYGVQKLTEMIGQDCLGPPLSGSAPARSLEASGYLK